MLPTQQEIKLALRPIPATWLQTTKPRAKRNIRTHRRCGCAECQRGDRHDKRGLQNKTQKLGASSVTCALLARTSQPCVSARGCKHSPPERGCASVPSA